MQLQLVTAVYASQLECWSGLRMSYMSCTYLVIIPCGYTSCSNILLKQLIRRAYTLCLCVVLICRAYTSCLYVVLICRAYVSCLYVVRIRNAHTAWVRVDQHLAAGANEDDIMLEIIIFIGTVQP